MSADNLSAHILDHAGLRLESLLGAQKFPVRVAPDKTNILAFVSGNRLQPPLGGHFFYVCFLHGPQGKQSACELIPGKPGQKIGLVLLPVEAFEQAIGAGLIFFNNRIMPGG